MVVVVVAVWRIVSLPRYSNVGRKAKDCKDSLSLRERRDGS